MEIHCQEFVAQRCVPQKSAMWPLGRSPCYMFSLLCAAVSMTAIYTLGAPVFEHKISGAAHNDTQPLALQWAFGLQWMAPPEPIGPPPAGGRTMHIHIFS